MMYLELLSNCILYHFYIVFVVFMTEQLFFLFNESKTKEKAGGITDN